jgi:hypothetical protein
MIVVSIPIASTSSLKTSQFVANYTATLDVLFEVKESAVIDSRVVIRLGLAFKLLYFERHRLGPDGEEVRSFENEEVCLLLSLWFWTHPETA